MLIRDINRETHLFSPGSNICVTFMRVRWRSNVSTSFSDQQIFAKYNIDENHLYSTIKLKIYEIILLQRKKILNPNDIKNNCSPHSISDYHFSYLSHILVVGLKLFVAAVQTEAVYPSISISPNISLLFPEIRLGWVGAV